MKKSNKAVLRGIGIGFVMLACGPWAIAQANDPGNQSVFVQPHPKLSGKYSGYLVTPHQAGGGAHVTLQKNSAYLADFDVFATASADGSQKNLLVLGSTPDGMTSLELIQTDMKLTLELDGDVIGESTAIQCLKDGTPVYSYMEYYMGNVGDVDAIGHISPALGDPNLRGLLNAQVSSVMTAALFGPVTPVACTAGECNNLYPGQGPLDKIRNCICQCCIDEGGCFAYIDTFYGGDIGCSGPGVIGQIAFFACTALCVPIGPFAGASTSIDNGSAVASD